MLLLFLLGSGTGAPTPPATNYDQYLYGMVAPDGPLSTDTDPAEMGSTLSDHIENIGGS